MHGLFSKRPCHCGEDHSWDEAGRSHPIPHGYIHPFHDNHVHGWYDGTVLPAVPRFHTNPPPGTLGMTYRRPSRLIPVEKHPRIGMLEVRGVPAGISVEVTGIHGEKTDAYRGDDGIWYVETELPMIPGVPHVYVVKTMPAGDGLIAPDVRMVRFIYGRIVSLDF